MEIDYYLIKIFEFPFADCAVRKSLPLFRCLRTQGSANLIRRFLMKYFLFVLLIRYHHHLIDRKPQDYIRLFLVMSFAVIVHSLDLLADIEGRRNKQLLLNFILDLV